MQVAHSRHLTNRFVPILILGGFLCAFGQAQDKIVTLDSVTIYVFMLSLAAQFSFREMPGFRGNVEELHPDVILLDSNLAHNYLPKLSIGKFILLSTSGETHL